MTPFLELLELVYRAHEGIEAFVAEYRECLHPRPSGDLTVGLNLKDGEPSLRWRDEGPFPRAAVVHRKIWLADACARIEIVRANRPACVAVRRAGRWWRWDEINGASNGTFGSGPAFVPPLLDPQVADPARLLATMRFEPAGIGRRAGRDVVCARAWARRNDASGVARECELEFDAQHGTILRESLVQEGWPVLTVEAVAVQYDGRIDPDRFEFQPPRAASLAPLHSSPRAAAERQP
jgi:hypothetical protein